MRYCFSLLKGYVWKDMFTDPKNFWGMWGVRQTLKYIAHDTFQNWGDYKRIRKSIKK